MVSILFGSPQLIEVAVGGVLVEQRRNTNQVRSHPAPAHSTRASPWSSAS
jgi:hypothetical protein